MACDDKLTAEKPCRRIPVTRNRDDATKNMTDKIFIFQTYLNCNHNPRLNRGFISSPKGTKQKSNSEKTVAFKIKF